MKVRIIRNLCLVMLIATISVRVFCEENKQNIELLNIEIILKKDGKVVEKRLVTSEEAGKIKNEIRVKVFERLGVKSPKELQEKKLENLS